MASKLNTNSSRREFDSLSKDHKKSKLARLSKAYSTSDLSKVRRTGFAGVVNRVSRSTVDLSTKSEASLSKRFTRSSVDLLTESFRNRTEHPAKSKTLERLTKNIEKDRNSESVRQRDSDSAARQRWQGATLSSQAKTKEARMTAEKAKKRSTRLPPIETQKAKPPVEVTNKPKPVRQDSVRPMAGRPSASAKGPTRQSRANFKQVNQPPTAAKSRVFSAPKPRETSASNPKSAKAQQRNFEAAVCKPCRLNITEKLRRGYNKYKKLDKPKQCGKCSKHSIDFDFYDICWDCAKQAGVCAKCAAGSTKISGAKFFEVVKSGMEENMLGMTSNQLKRFAEKHATVHRLESVLTPMLNSETCSRKSSPTSTASSASPTSSAKSSPSNSRVSSAQSSTSRASSAKHSPVVSVHSARSDMARTMTSSSSPVPDPVDSDEAYGSGMISAVESRHGALSQQVSYKSDRSVEDAEIIDKIRSLTNLDSRSPTMAQTVLREIRSLTDMNYNSDVLDTVDVFTNSRHQSPETAASPKQKSIVYDADIHPNISSRTSTSLSRERSSPKLAPLTDLVSPRSSPLPPILSPRASLEHQSTVSRENISECSSRPLTEGGYMNEEFEEPEPTVLFEDKPNSSQMSRSISEDISNVGVQEEISNVGSLPEELSNVESYVQDSSHHSEEIMITPAHFQAEEVMITPAPVKDNSEIDNYDVVDIDAQFDATYNVEETIEDTTQDFNDNTYNLDETTIDETAEDFDDDTYTVDATYDDVFDDSVPALEHDGQYPNEGIVTLEQTDTVTHPQGNEELYNYGLYDDGVTKEATDNNDDYGLYARSEHNLTETTTVDSTSTLQQYPSTSSVEHENFTSSYGNANINIMSMSTTGESFESTYESDYTNTDDSGLGDKALSSDLIHRVPPISPTQEDWDEYQQQIQVARDECGLQGQYEILELHQSSDYPDMEFLENICYEYRGYPMRCRLEDIQEEGTLSKETTCVTCITAYTGDTSELDQSMQTLQGIAQTSVVRGEVERCEPIMSSDYLENGLSDEADDLVEAGRRALDEELASLKQAEEVLERENSLTVAAKDVVMGALLRVSVSDQLAAGL